MNSMLSNNEANMEVIEFDKKAKNKKYTNSGHLSAKQVSIEHRPTFSDVSVKSVVALCWYCMCWCVVVCPVITNFVSHY